MVKMLSAFVSNEDGFLAVGSLVCRLSRTKAQPNHEKGCLLKKVHNPSSLLNRRTLPNENISCKLLLDIGHCCISGQWSRS